MKTCKKLFFALIIFCVINACNNEETLDVSKKDEATYLKEARIWYNNQNIESIMMKISDTEVAYMKPVWNKSRYYQNNEMNSVETSLVSNVGVVYYGDGCKEKYNETKDSKYLHTQTRLVIKTNLKTNDKTAFIMTIVPNLSYLEYTNFKPFRKFSFLDNQNFSGDILYSDLKGNFLSGWKFENGQINYSINGNNVSQSNPSLRATVCKDTVITKKVIRCIIYNIIDFENFDSKDEFFCDYVDVEEVQRICRYQEPGDPSDPTGPGDGEDPVSNPTPCQFQTTPLLAAISDFYQGRTNICTKIEAENNLRRILQEPIYKRLYDKIISERQLFGINIYFSHGVVVSEIDIRNKLIETVCDFFYDQFSQNPGGPRFEQMVFLDISYIKYGYQISSCPGIVSSGGFSANSIHQEYKSWIESFRTRKFNTDSDIGRFTLFASDYFGGVEVDYFPYFLSDYFN